MDRVKDKRKMSLLGGLKEAKVIDEAAAEAASRKSVTITRRVSRTTGRPETSLSFVVKPGEKPTEVYEIQMRQLHLVDQIGTGSFGEVYKEEIYEDGVLIEKKFL